MVHEICVFLFIFLLSFLFPLFCFLLLDHVRVNFIKDSSSFDYRRNDPFLVETDSVTFPNTFETLRWREIDAWDSYVLHFAICFFDYLIPRLFHSIIELTKRSNASLLLEYLWERARVRSHRRTRVHRLGRRRNSCVKCFWAVYRRFSR